MTKYQVNYDLIKELSDTTSSSGGTSLITYFIPANSEIKLATEHFTIEMSSAQNIKDKTVRNDTRSAIRSAQQLLNSYDKFTAPTNGLVLLAGNTKSYI